MDYYCKDCSYRGNKRGRDGGCPACDSRHLQRLGGPEEGPKSTKWRLVLLVALWAYLIGLIIWKLNN